MSSSSRSPGSTMQHHNAPTAYPGHRSRNGRMSAGGPPSRDELRMMRDELERRSRDERLDDIMKTMDASSIMQAAAMGALPVVGVQIVNDLIPAAAEAHTKGIEGMPLRQTARALKEMGLSSDISAEIAPEVHKMLREKSGDLVTRGVAEDVLTARGLAGSAASGAGLLEKLRGSTLKELDYQQAVDRLTPDARQELRRRVLDTIETIRPNLKDKIDPPRHLDSLWKGFRKTFTPAKVALPLLAGAAMATYGILDRRKKYKELLGDVRRSERMRGKEKLSAYEDELLKIAQNQIEQQAGGGMGSGEEDSEAAPGADNEPEPTRTSDVDQGAPPPQQQQVPPTPAPPMVPPPPRLPHLPEPGLTNPTSPVIRAIGSRVQQFDPRRAQGFPLLQPPPGFVFAPHLQAFMPGPGWLPGNYAQQAAINAQIYQRGRVDANTEAAATRMAEQQQEAVMKDHQKQQTQAMMMAAQQRSLMRSAAKPGGAI